MLNSQDYNKSDKKEKQDFHHAWLILAGCCAFIMSVLGIINSCQGLFVLPVTNALGISRTEFSLVITLQSLMGVFTMPLAGKILPKYNIRIVLSIALAIYIGSFAALSLCSSIQQFLVVGAIIGLAGGFLTFIPVAIILGNWFNEKLGFAMGLALSFTGIGGAIFNPIGTMLIQNYGWKSGYQILGLIALVIAMPSTMFIFRFQPSDMGLQPYGKPLNKDNSITGISSIVAFKSASFYFIVFWSITIGMLGGVMYHIPAFVNELNYPAFFAGTVMSVYMGSITIGKIILGYLNDRIGPLISTGIYGTLTFAGILCFLLSGRKTVFLFAGAVLFGQGMSLMLVETPILVRKIFGTKDYSAIYSIISVIVSGMSALSILGYGFIFDKTHSYFPSMWIILSFPLLGFMWAVLALRSSKKIL